MDEKVVSVGSVVVTASRYHLYGGVFFTFDNDDYLLACIYNCRLLSKTVLPDCKFDFKKTIIVLQNYSKISDL